MNTPSVLAEAVLCAVQDTPTRLSVTTLASDAEALSDYLQSKGIEVSPLGPEKPAAFGHTRIPQLVRQFTVATNIDSLAEHTANWVSGI
jgi:hypothetical protein